MEKIKITELLKATDGKLYGNDKTIVSGVSIDSRTTKNGDIFFAIKGENFDGHNFIQAAIKKGAVAITVSRLPSSVFRLPSPVSRLPFFVTDNTLTALQNFAKHYRQKFNVKVIGITGSNGKTTTKDILTSILSQKKHVLSTTGNLNNHIGVPLTLFNLEKKHKYCVLEMGTNHKGEIAQLCKISLPTVGVITNIGTAHIGNFGSLSNTLKAKMELFRSLSKNDVAVINNDDKLISTAVKNMKCKKIIFGIINDADVMASDISLGNNNTTFFLKHKKKKIKVALPVPGIFNVYNALAASSCAVMMGYTIDDIATGIQNFVAPGKRMETVKLKNGAVIVNDCYNANPTSMKLAIENFSKIYYNNKKILVLGDMLELGKFEISEHKKIGKLVKTNNYANEVLTIGELAKYISQESNGKWFNNKTELSEYLIKNLKCGDAVLFKASRKIALDEVVNSLISAKAGPDRNRD